MKKLLVTLGIVLGVLLICGFVVSFFLGSIVKAGVNRMGPKITGTTVTLDSARISPWTGAGSLQGLYIGNPPGWQSDKLAYLGRVSVDVAPMSLMGDTIVIQDVDVEQPEFVYETKLINSNVNDLLKQVEKALGGGTDSSPASDAKPKKIAIKHLVLRDAKVTVGIGASAVTVPMPNIELHDLGTPENGLTPNQLIFAVSKQIVANIVSSAAGAIKTIGVTSGAAAAEGVKKMGESIKGFFNKEEKAKP